ncbi:MULTISPECIES: glyceraldehyde-3-phosphate dehydrogenase [Micrococcaceae]|uniref:glyceraldehyde-3-phosphate dehydrogenase n=1 Tax=Micrococcaceae TaxID=1268 RepID=UPI00161F5D20|nr:glyceraldehyde-3-phosphate dehydrogenase [Citricoccus sp.]MBB5748512.1 glyceraldehyde 3-phosphate dehydrogenase [Micrococcus sp. TA1]HRO30100.1 glyceraldehyde-3-phosphate dehydrogenase [Citricoccus sp.]HRO93692.1 glyceraldehyde-3-phosphate dehydrogenase [Citricoccus sp.]
MAEETTGIAQDQRAAWNNREELAEKMVPLIGTLYRDHNVITSIYGRQLVHKGVIDIIKAHRYARQIDESVLPVEDTFPIVEAMAGMNLGAASVDLAKLANKYKETGGDLQSFLDTELAEVAGKGGGGLHEPTDVVLYGFGRIGRLLARIILSHEGGGSSLRLRAIVVRKNSDNDLVKRASLLRRDSIHGPFEGTITVDEENNTITANGTVIQVIYSNDPASIDYTAFGIKDAVVVDNTGRWRDEEGLGQHLKSKGVAKVLLTAPGKGDIKNIVFGVNTDDITEQDTILSAASCTTNGITPVLKIINDEYGIDHGHVETVHAYTNDQNLTDNFHKGSRRGRAAGLNMVLTETGAAKAVAKALPELKGKLSGNAIRVPTPNVSMAILNLELEKETSVEELNAHLRNESLTGALRAQMDYIHSPEVVSSDFVGSNRAGIVDGLATIVNDGKNAIVYVWYDNEFGYSCQVVRVIEKMAGDAVPVLPRD